MFICKHKRRGWVKELQHNRPFLHRYQKKHSTKTSASTPDFKLYVYCGRNIPWKNTILQLSF